MVCKKCGNQIAEGELLCAQCGTPIAEQPVEEQPVAENAAQEEMVTEQISAENTEFAQPQFDAPAKKPKKKLTALIAAVVAVVLAGTVAVGAFVEPIKGLAIKTFGSDTDYLQFVEDKAVDQITDEIVEVYGDYLENLSNTKTTGAADMSLQLNVSDKAIALIENALKDANGPAIDLDWFDNISVDMHANMQEKALQDGLSLKLNGKELANAELIMDMDKGVVYVAILSMSEKYLKYDLEIDKEIEDMMKMVSPAAIKEILPSEKTVAALVEKYTAIVYENMEDVVKSSEILEIGEIQQKLTTLEVEIDWATARNISIAVLETAKNDADLEKIIKDVAKYLKDNGQIDDANDVYDDFRDRINEAIDELNGEEPENANEKLRIVTYVNGDHEVVGRKFTFDGESTRYVTVRDGDNFAFEMKASEVKITGAGIEKKDVLNGKFTLKVDNKVICDVTAQDLSTKDNMLNGKAVVTPSSEFLESIGLGSTGASVVALANPELEFAFENTKDSSKMDINLLSGKEMLFGITLTAKEAETAEIKMPDSGKVVEDTEVENWLQSFDFEGLVNKLKDAGVPSDLLQGVFG